MSWKNHCWEIRTKIYRGLWALWKAKHVLPLTVRKKLVVSCLLPHLRYGCIIMPELDANSRDVIQRAFNDCLRFVFSVKKTESVSKYEKSLLGCTLSNYRKFLECKFLYGLITTKVPDYLFGLLTPATSARTLNFIVPRAYTETFSRSFFAHAVTTWNSLPPSINAHRFHGLLP